MSLQLRILLRPIFALIIEAVAVDASTIAFAEERSATLGESTKIKCSARRIQEVSGLGREHRRFQYFPSLTLRYIQDGWVRWLHFGNELGLLGNKYNYENHDKFRRSDGGDDFYLQINNVTHDDAGMYQCVLKNNFGEHIILGNVRLSVIGTLLAQN